jgi:drug/metabolite transporter (DMT)-like permease
MPHVPHLTGESLKIIIIMLIGWTSFAFGDVMSKFLTQSYEPSLVVTYSAIVGVIILSTYIYRKKGISGFKWHNPKYCAMRLFFSGMISLTVVMALANIPIAEMYGITFSTPFFTVILTFYLLKEQVGLHRWLSIVTGFIGVLILLGPKFDDFNIGLLYAIIAMICMSINGVLIRKIGQHEYMPNFILISLLGHFFVSLIFSAPHLFIPSAFELLEFVFYALLILGGISLTTYSFTHAKNMASIAPLVYVQVIWGVLCGYLIFDNLPTLTTWIGLLIVISAGLYMIHKENKLRRIANH